MRTKKQTNILKGWGGHTKIQSKEMNEQPKKGGGGRTKIHNEETNEQTKKGGGCTSISFPKNAKYKSVSIIEVNKQSHNMLPWT